MPEKKRYYRKKLTSQGLIYIGGEEVEMLVRNLSVTGLLAEIPHHPTIKTAKDLFDVIRVSAAVDIYLSEMHLVGEAEIVRGDLIDGQIYLALEFTRVSYDIDNLLYKRKTYRKEVVAPGMIVLNGEKYTFTTRNVSVSGLFVHLKEKLDVREGMVTFFDFKHLNLKGQIKVVWVEEAEDGGTYMGLEYEHMEKTDIQGIPRFGR